MADTYEQENLFNDPTVAQEERALFGDQVRPTRPELDSEGDFLHGWFRGIKRNVDLKTGYNPVDIVTIEAVSGRLASGTKRPQAGRLYAVALLHATSKNRFTKLDPEPADGERIAVRRGRQFVATQGEGEGKEMTAWDWVCPDRPAVEPEPAAKGRKAAS